MKIVDLVIVIWVATLISLLLAYAFPAFSSWKSLVLNGILFLGTTHILVNADKEVR